MHSVMLKATFKGFALVKLIQTKQNKKLKIMRADQTWKPFKDETIWTLQACTVKAVPLSH